jgi:hypothetical protein
VVAENGSRAAQASFAAPALLVPAGLAAAGRSAVAAPPVLAAVAVVVHWALLLVVAFTSKVSKVLSDR